MTVREHVMGTRVGERNFRWRGTEVSRLEGFSDGVFGFAVTLLVVSLEVPRTFAELAASMRGFGTFGVCFALLAQVWFLHYRFFRRYGLQDTVSVVLNCLLLFFVLFFVYPLKFLWQLVIGGASLKLWELRELFAIYGLGYAAIFAVFVLLYGHAWRQRDVLELSPMELLKTRHRIYDNVAMVAVGTLSALIAAVMPDGLVALAGYFYFSIGIYFTVSGTLFGRQERRMEAQGTSPG